MSGRVGAEQTPDIEAVEVISEAMYEAVMEATSDHWRQWRFLKPEVKDRYRAEGSRLLTQALAPVLAAAVREARAAEDRVRVGFRYRDGEILSPEREAESADEEVPVVVLDLGDGEWMTLDDLRADRIAVDAPEGGA